MTLVLLYLRCVLIFFCLVLYAVQYRHYTQIITYRVHVISTLASLRYRFTIRQFFNIMP